MNKRGIYFLIISLIFIFIILTNIVSAASCGESNDNQLIMRISSNTNAHGEIYSGTNYGVEICYDDIFEVAYNGANPHDCTATLSNKILGLSANTNAHAQESSLDTYDIDICYGNLGCSFVLAGEECATGFTCVVTLSSSTNAHLAKCDIVGSSYNNKICCKPGAVTPPPTGCGDGDLDVGEDCDGDELGEKTKCEDLDMGLTGRLGCTSTCLYDASACVQSCSGYTSSETCGEDFFSAAKFDIENIKINPVDDTFCGQKDCTLTGGGTGTVSTTCKCVWIDANGCVAEWTRTDSCSSENDGTCTYFGGDTIDNCDTTGEYSISWTATWAGGSQQDPCEDGSHTFACPTIAELPFFTTISIITSLFLITAIYFIKIFSKKGEYSKKV